MENRFPLRNNINMGVLERDERDMVFSSSSIFSLKLLSYLCPHEKQNLCYVCHFLSPGCCVCTLNSTNHPPTPFLPFDTLFLYRSIHRHAKIVNGFVYGKLSAYFCQNVKQNLCFCMSLHVSGGS